MCVTRWRCSSILFFVPFSDHYSLSSMSSHSSLKSAVGCCNTLAFFCIHEKKYCFVKQTSSEPGNTLFWSGSADKCWLSSQGQVSTDRKSLFEEFVSMAPGLSEHLGFLPRCSKSTPQVTTLFYQNKQLRNECDKKDDSFSDTLDFELQTFWWMNMQIVGQTTLQ